jgi:hypothetical protein
MYMEEHMNINTRDILRQAITLIATIFQVVAGVLPTSTIAQVSNENRTSIVPADYAFAIWGPIFFLALIYAVYQALPANRQNTLLRQIGWWFAGACVCNGTWELLFPAKLFVLAQIVIVAIFVCLLVAFLRFVVFSRKHALTAPERWIVAPTLSLFFGWISAATLVGLAITLISVGVLHSRSSEAFLGAVLLLLCSIIAGTVVILGRMSPVQGYFVYAAAVVWALIGVVVNQYMFSTVTTSVAVISAILVTGIVVAAFLFSNRPSHRKRVLF